MKLSNICNGADYFDKRLLAIADCPVINISQDVKEEKSGGIIFNPHPVINATSNDVLAHELCHLLRGKKVYDIFRTAVVARNEDERFKWLLNALYDWYDESLGREHSVLISSYLLQLRKSYKLEENDRDPYVNKILHLLNNEVTPEEGSRILGHKIRDHLDLVVLADIYHKKIKTKTFSLVQTLKRCRHGAPASAHVTGPESNFYLRTVSKYYSTIKMLSRLWSRNKYNWNESYFGEINWQNLPQLVIGDKINLPVFRLWKKIIMNRNVYIVIDRSGSTIDIKVPIMETAVILAESLIQAGTPVSILDCGSENNIINKIGEPIKYKWFTPAAVGGTPLGEVCEKIKDSDTESFLLIITDGEPDDWDSLKKALYKFKGSYLTCVIGFYWKTYASYIGNTIQVEPTTIIRGLLSNDNSILCEDR